MMRRPTMPQTGGRSKVQDRVARDRVSNEKISSHNSENVFFECVSSPACRVVSLAELAAIEGMPSEPTLRRLIEKYSDFPFISQPVRGAAFAIDLDAAVEFVRARWSDGRRSAARAAHRKSGTLAHLAAMPGMPSEVTLRQLIAKRPDFPLIERGGDGHAYKMDLDVAAEFVRSVWRDGRKPQPAPLPLFPSDDIKERPL